jgi:RNA polymerase sigma-70 factor (ECF subfamily)
VIGDEFAAVLRSAQAGGEDAFERLWHDLNPSLMRYLSLGGEPAEDVAAETWATVAVGLRRFRGDENAWRAWVFTTARRRAVDAGRRRSRHATRSTDWSHLAAEGSPPSSLRVRDCADDALESLDTRAALRLVASLPRLQAEVVMLRVVAGLPVDAVAAIVGRSAGAVRVAAHRGLRELAARLGDPSHQTDEVTPDPVRHRADRHPRGDVTRWGTAALRE